MTIVLPVDSETTRQAAQQVYDCLLDMGQQQTNPVLQLFEFGQVPVENRKYPEGFLQFNDCGWRAYYHCHPAEGHGRSGKHCFNHEHGHFHFFVRTGENPEAWSHLVALSMDSDGQPLGWFTVNHWVTGESWQSAEALTMLLVAVPHDRQENLLERWLLAMVALDSERISLLLTQRDEVLAGRASQSARQDKQLYILSEAPLSLLDLLERQLSM